jgi:membrane protease YdiL (CAAX protease family)
MRQMNAISLNLKILFVSMFVNFIFALYNLWNGDDLFFILNIVAGVFVGYMYLRNKRLYNEVKEKTWRSYK